MNRKPLMNRSSESYKDDPNLDKAIEKSFKDVKDWEFVDDSKDKINVIFKDGSSVILSRHTIADESLDNNSTDKKVGIFEALTDSDVEALSKLSLDEDEIAKVLSMFELVSEENKDKMLGIITSLFEGKKLVSDETEEVSENINRRNAVSEGYTRRLLGDN